MDLFSSELKPVLPDVVIAIVPVGCLQNGILPELLPEHLGWQKFKALLLPLKDPPCLMVYARKAFPKQIRKYFYAESHNVN
jgi:hypothetical protein